jgi:hypothetical protein
MTHFKLFLSCNPQSHESLKEFVERTLGKFTYGGFGMTFDTEFVRKVLSNVVLLLALDEVPNRWVHSDYYSLPDFVKSMFGFSSVVLMVGSTALNQDVSRQPTNVMQVVNIRMSTIRHEKRSQILEHHLIRELRFATDRGRRDKELQTSSFVEKLLDKIPYLDDLLGNHRCAFLTAKVLINIFGKEYWDEKLDEGSCEGNLEYLLIKVADEYRARNGLRSLSMQQCRTYMLQSLALVASQKYDVHCVKKAPKEGSLAVLSKKLVEYGLVERAINLDEHTSDDTEVAVSDRYEFEMTPAVTMLCVGTLFPWIGGIRGAAERFEALVAVMLVVLRYAQTNVRYPIHRLRHAVPYSGNETDKFYCPSIPIDEICLINGPKAPFADVMIAGVPPRSKENPCASDLMKALSKLVNESKISVGPLLVQCKHTSNVSASCCFNDECAKTGFLPDGTDSKSSENPYQEDAKRSKKYRAANKLKRTSWVYHHSHDADTPSFAFMGECRIFMGESAEAEYAWEKLYPFIQLNMADSSEAINYIEM